MTNYVNSVQQVTITIASGATTGTASITAVTDTAILLYQGHETSATTSLAQAMCNVTLSGTTVTATRNTSSTNTITVNAIVVDASSTNLIKSVQMGTITHSTTSNSATISSVVTGNSVVVLNGFTSGRAAFDYEVDTPILSLTNSTTVTSTIAAFTTACVVSYCVIEFQGTALNQSTQFFSKAWTNSSLTTTQAITSVNTANTMLIYAGSHNGNTVTGAFDQQSIVLTNGTTVTIATGNADGDAIKCNFWVVEFVAGVLSQTAQRGTTALSAVTSNTSTITSATTTQTVTTFCGFTTSITAVTSLATVLPRVKQTSATVITANKNTGTGLSTISWEALTFSTGGGGGTTYNDSFTETVTASDSESVAVTFNASNSDSVTAADSETVATTFRASTSDSVTGADSEAATTIFNPAISDSVTGADSLSVTATYNNSTSDNCTASDSMSQGGTSSVDTHDGFRKKRIYLPEYFSKKKEVPPIIPEQWREQPVELEDTEVEVPKPLLKYDIDWELVAQYAQQTEQKLSKIISQMERERAAYEHEMNMQDMDFMMLAMAASHAV